MFFSHSTWSTLTACLPSSLNLLKNPTIDRFVLALVWFFHKRSIYLSLIAFSTLTENYLVVILIIIDPGMTSEIIWTDPVSVIRENIHFT